MVTSGSSKLIAFGFAALATNALLALTCLPLLVILMTTNPRDSWPLVAILVPLCAPALCGASAVFGLVNAGEHALDHKGLVSTFFNGWRAGWRRSVCGAALASLLIVIAGVDFAVVATHQFALLVGPVLVLVAITAALAGLYSVVISSCHPTAGVIKTLAAAVTVAIRRWPTTLAAVVIGAVQVSVFLRLPAIAVGFTAAPALYVIWSNIQHAVTLVLRNASEPPTAGLLVNGLSGTPERNNV